MKLKDPINDLGKSKKIVACEHINLTFSCTSHNFEIRASKCKINERVEAKIKALNSGVTWTGELN